MRRAALVALVSASALTALAGCSNGGAGRGNQGGGHPAVATVVLTVHHSRFSRSAVRVRAGTVVRFVVHNADPIDHELIVGDEAVQRRHETGTETHHGDRPGEVSVPAGTAAGTTYVVPARPARVLFGCHLPGHWAYGMHGTVVVTP